MAQAKVIAIAAIDRKRGIGNNKDLIFKIPEDMKRFREVTTGHPIITGRKNFESMGRPLPRRPNILVTKDLSYKPAGVIVTHSIEEALAEAHKLDDEKIYIIGGGKTYEAALPFTDQLDLTLIDDERPADTFFPDYSEFKKILSEERHEYQGIPFTYTILER